MNRLALPILALVLVPPAQQSRDPSKDYGKRAVELPVEHALHGTAAAKPPEPGVVAPGLVRWHADFEAACAAAERSRRPVLLFQLLGRLDEEFC